MFFNVNSQLFLCTQREFINNRRGETDQTYSTIFSCLNVKFKKDCLKQNIVSPHVTYLYCEKYRTLKIIKNKLQTYKHKCWCKLYLSYFCPFYISQIYATSYFMTISP